MTRSRRVWGTLCVALIQASIGCVGSASDETDPLARIARAGRAAVGLPEDALGVVADAVVHGPGYEFRTLVHSGADGTLRMEQTTGFLAVLTGEESWGHRRGEWMTPLDAFDEAFARGHELHALAFWPETRGTDPVLLGVVPFLDGEAIGVRWTVNGMGTQTLFYQVEDTLPVGLRTDWVDPPVEVRFGAWEPVRGADSDGGGSREERAPLGDLRLFRSATFDQAGEIFEYAYDRIELGPVPDSLLVPPADSLPE